MLASKESCCDQNQIHRHCIFTSRNFFHSHASGLFVFFTLKFHKNSLTQLSFLILDKFFDRCGIHTRICTKNCDCLLLAIIGLADSRPFRPWIGCSSLIRCLGHHFQLNHTFCSMTDGSSDTVISCISTTDDHDLLSFCRNICAIL